MSHMRPPSRANFEKYVACYVKNFFQLHMNCRTVRTEIKLKSEEYYTNSYFCEKKSIPNKQMLQLPSRKTFLRISCRLC